MHKEQGNTFECPVCQKRKFFREGLHPDAISPPIAEFIHKQRPDLGAQSYVCAACIEKLRSEYIQDVIESDRKTLFNLKKETARSLKKQELVSHNINVEFEQELTLGERAADKIAEFGGSWYFIGLFGAVLFSWLVINTITLAHWKPFDPYPYILMNLILSCLAAIQAPIIMMSQNRQEAKDRMQSEHDYHVNMKAELEIRHLHAKIDQLLTNQWQRLLEIQQIQMEMMEEIVHKK